MLEKIQHCEQPNGQFLWHKSRVTALKEEEYVKRSMAYVHAQRKKLIKNLTLLGYKTFDSKANYIFFQGEEETL